MAKDPYRYIGINSNFDSMGTQNRIIRVSQISWHYEAFSYFDSNKTARLKRRSHRLSKQRVKLNKKRGLIENV